jgi:hypothetical protein
MLKLIYPFNAHLDFLFKKRTIKVHKNEPFCFNFVVKLYNLERRGYGTGV